jgi:hypothetical protein
MKEYPQPSRPSRGVIEVERRPTLVSVTVRASAHSRSLADAIVHSILREVWLRADYWEVGTYVLMPHHLHFLTWPGQVECDLDKWIQYWNSLATKRLGRTEYGWQRCSFH